MPIVGASPATNPSQVAPNITTYASRTPYLTLAEWLAAPTAIDITNLIPGGTQEMQNQAITNEIERASSWVDRICFQVLAATSDITSGRFLVNRWGAVRIPLPRKPVLEVSSVSVGSTPSTMTALSSLADVEISPNGVITVPVYTMASPVTFGSSFGSGSRPLVTVTWVNGWPNTTLAVGTAAGVSSLTVASALGIYPGTVLTVYDVSVTGGTEQVTVSSSYVAGSTTVTLAAPTVYAHTTGISISNLPPVVKEATILLTTALIQTRGADALVLGSTEPPTGTTTSGTIGQAERLAGVMLADLRRAW